MCPTIHCEFVVESNARQEIPGSIQNKHRVFSNFPKNLE